MMRRRTQLGLVTIGQLVVIVVVAAVFGITGVWPGGQGVSGTVDNFRLYSLGCGCCDDYGDLLLEEGYFVKISVPEHLIEVKEENDVPEEVWSCLTVTVRGYFLEGHVPLEAVAKLLDEEPSLDGLALPGIAIGTVDPPVPSEGHLVVYAISDGKISEYMTI